MKSNTLQFWQQVQEDFKDKPFFCNQSELFQTAWKIQEERDNIRILAIDFNCRYTKKRFLVSDYGVVLFSAIITTQDRKEADKLHRSIRIKFLKWIIKKISYAST